MAIPTWLWSSENAAEDALELELELDDPSADADSEHARDFETVSNELDVLANPVRLEILTTLARRDGPLRYSELRAAISIEDNGKLNYHLRTLEDLVANTEGEYRLTTRGRRLVDRVLDLAETNRNR